MVGVVLACATFFHASDLWSSRLAPISITAALNGFLGTSPFYALDAEQSHECNKFKSRNHTFFLNFVSDF